MSVDPQSLSDQSACYQCAGVSLTEGMILALLAQVSAGGGILPALHYAVTSSDYAPVAGTQVTITAQLVDAHGNAVHTAGLVVTWSKTGAGGSFASPTSITNASGIATVVFTTSVTNGVAYVITGTDTNGVTGASAVITSAASAATHYVVSADDTTPDYNQVVAISAQLADVGGNPVLIAGLTVTWSKTGTKGSFSSPTSLTNASGIATVNFTAVFGTYTVTATDVNAITGTSANLVTALSAQNSDWLSRIQAAVGVRPSDNTFIANDVYYSALVAAGLTGKIFAANLFAPDSLIAAATPFIRLAGSASWGLGLFVNGDLTVNGLKGDGISKLLNTGIPPSSYMTTASSHTCIYISDDTQVTGQCELGAWDGGTGSVRQFSHGPTGSTWSSNNNFLNWNIATPLLGYVCGSRTTTTRFDAYFSNSTTPHASVFNDTALNPGTIPANALYCLASNENGATAFYSTKRISYASTGLGLTTAESLAHFNAIQQFRVDVGGGFF